MGIQPLLRLFKGILKSNIEIPAKITRYIVMSFMRNRQVMKII